MDGLPLELYESIFGYLDIGDLFTVRLLNKKFNYIVSQCRIQELAVFNPETVHRGDRYRENPEFVPYKSNWFSSNRPKDFLRLVDGSKLSLLKNPVESSLFTLKFLKRLKVDCFKGDHSFRLKDVNRFAGSLEELEIMIDGRSDEDKLTLPKLRILQISLRGSYRYEFSVSIEAAKLEAVCFARSDYSFTSPGHFQFAHPLTVSYLKTGAIHESILAFSNLQHLEITSHLHVDANVLSHFVGLKELTILGYERHAILAMRPAGARDLKINHEVPAWSWKDGEVVFYSDYCRISNSKLLLSANQIPTDFFTQFNGILMVCVYSKVQDPNHLLEFLDNCPLLSDLLIHGRTQLNQRFFDQLPAVCSLNCLQLEGEPKLGLDYSFILRMFFLRCLKTNEELSTGVICKLGVPFHLQSVEFAFGEKRVPLKRLKGDRYLVLNYLELGLSDRSKTMKPERLAKHFSSLRSQSAGNDGRKRQRTH